jgi:hypothetical protein
VTAEIFSKRVREFKYFTLPEKCPNPETNNLDISLISISTTKKNEKEKKPGT